MKTLNISISDIESNKFELSSNDFCFSGFIDLISRELSVQRLEESVRIVKTTGLSGMTMADITEEVKAERNNEKIKAQRA